MDLRNGIKACGRHYYSQNTSVIYNSRQSHVQSGNGTNLESLPVEGEPLLQCRFPRVE